MFRVLELNSGGGEKGAPPIWGVLKTTKKKPKTKKKTKKTWWQKNKIKDMPDPSVGGFRPIPHSRPTLEV